MPDPKTLRYINGMVSGELDSSSRATFSKSANGLDEQRMITVPVVAGPDHEVRFRLEPFRSPKVRVHSHVDEMPSLGRYPPPFQHVELRRCVDVKAGG